MRVAALGHKRRAAENARHVELFRRVLTQVLLLRNENPLFKKLLAVAHVEHSGLAAW